MIVRTGPKAEAGLRKLGFTIPVRPKTGEVKYDGEIVGWIDNFTGLRIEDKNLKVCHTQSTTSELVLAPKYQIYF